MLESFVSRENAVFEALQVFLDAGPEFVVVGGYGVSAFQRRYSIDADLLVREKDLPEFSRLLANNGFRKTLSKNVGSVYAGVFQRWTKKEGLPVFIDLLVNALVVRQTNAAWSFEYVSTHSRKRLIQGIEKQVKAFVPEREWLIAVKLHSARLTDVRDAVALMNAASEEKIVSHALQGLQGGDVNGEKKLAESIRFVERELGKTQFADSFKGVFETKDFDEKSIQTLKNRVLKQLLEKLEETEKNR
ncbi:MAG: hypothetical protein V1817_03340 [Candidatus Micrarchaeota archaeon]